MDPAPPASCPRCRKVHLGDEPHVRHCPRCKGSWIAEEALHERVAEARGAAPGDRLTWRKEARAALMCAICAEPMETLVVQDTAVDRCPRHGVWFDVNELAHVLAAVALVAPLAISQAQAHAQAAQSSAGESTAAELVEGGAELALEAADAAGAVAEVAEASGGVFEVVINGVGVVGEAVVEVLAGIFSSLDF
jgi:Zn-finger nucleic acid-binding protein